MNCKKDKTMKKITHIWSCYLVLCLLFIGCSNTNMVQKETAVIEKDLKSYFSCYEKSDFEGMKKFCTKGFVEAYFHNEDVFGNSTAKLINFEEIKYDETTKKYTVTVQIKCMPVNYSALYNKDNPDEPVNTYMSFVLSVNNGNIVIEAFAD